VIEGDTTTGCLFESTLSKALSSKRNPRDTFGSEDASEIKYGSWSPPLASTISELVHDIDEIENKSFDTVARGGISSAGVYPSLFVLGVSFCQRVRRLWSVQCLGNISWHEGIFCCRLSE